MSEIRMFRQLAEAALGPKTGDRLFSGRSPDCVRRDQVGTRTLPQRGCGLKNREGEGCDRLELPNTPSSRIEDTDHVDRSRSSAMPNVHFQIARMISSHVPRCPAVCELYSLDGHKCNHDVKPAGAIATESAEQNPTLSLS